MHKPRIVVLGGGTGTFTVLSGLKKYPLHLSAVVSMADDGGSTGILRDELGVLPPGDVRQCLVALSSSDQLMRTLMNYRFTGGHFEGHSFGNLLLSALEKITGSFDEAVEKCSDILRIEGQVIPATLDKIKLEAVLKNNRKIIGQNKIHASNLTNLKTIRLQPKPKANPKAIEAIKKADVIVIGPGDFYSSLIPILLIPGIPEAIKKSRAKKSYVCNLMTKDGHTKGFSVHDFTEAIEQRINTSLDFVIYNNRQPPKVLIQRYARAGEYPTSHKLSPLKKTKTTYIGGDLLHRKIIKTQKHDLHVRNLIRHNPSKVAEIIFEIATS